ncbi:MAG: apolipoprotein N-acyltransferase [Acidimicrobiia bacterium]
MSSAPDGADPRLPGAAAAVASGLLLALTFPALDWGPLALVALVPLLWAWQRSGPARAALYGFVAGVAFFGVLLWWSVYFGVVAIVPLVCAQAAYWAGAGAIVGALGMRGVRSPWITAAAWVALEGLRVRWPLGGFAWGQVGVALHDFPVARALASFGGVPLVSFVVVLVNGLLLGIALGWKERHERPRALAVTAATLAGVVVLVAVAGITRYEPTTTGSLRFALLQGNDQDRRLTQAEIDSGYLTRKHLDLAHRLHGDFDLIVFPESSLETDPEVDPALRAELQAIGRQHHSAILANVIDDERRSGKTYNANRLYDPDGRLQGTYAKQHLVPFGEYVPFRDALSFISELQQIPTDFDAGHSTKVFKVHGKRVGTVICFESAFSPLMRSSVEKGAQAIVVTTNNRSYRRSPNSAQHVAVSQMSAAAVGRPVLHASISGITAVIGEDGNVTRSTRLFHNAVVTGRINTVRGETPYVRFGDWVEWACLIGLAGALVVALTRRRLSASEPHPHGSEQ